MEDIGAYLFGMMVGVALTGVIIMIIVACVGANTEDKVGSLGQAICEIEYGMDFESYSDEVLNCKPMKEKYDGLSVDIGR